MESGFRDSGKFRQGYMKANEHRFRWRDRFWKKSHVFRRVSCEKFVKHTISYERKSLMTLLVIFLIIQKYLPKTAYSVYFTDHLFKANKWGCLRCFEAPCDFVTTAGLGEVYKLWTLSLILLIILSCPSGDPRKPHPLLLNHFILVFET